MKIGFIFLLCLSAGLRLSTATALAQASVYSGVFTYEEGGLTTSSDWQQITNFVTNAQKDVSIINNFDSWTDTSSSTNGTQTFPTTEMSNIRSHGSIPMFTWQPQNGTEGTNQSFTLASIIAGDYDTYITNWAAAAKSWGYPFFLRFAHEMNGNWYPWCAGVNGNTSAQYVQMWQHVHNIFTGIGATNVTWVWCVDCAVYSGEPPITGLYAGDNYVDWLALDGYNRLVNPWQDFSAIAAATMAQLTNIAPGKPIMVAETGCNQNTNYSKSQWFLNALTNYLPSQPRIKAWVYFNSTNTSDGNDWRITVPSNAVVGYQQGIALSYYDTNEYGAISSSPIQPLLNDDATNDTTPPFVSIVSPSTDLVTNGEVVKFLALASGKYGVSNVVFALNGVAQQTNNAPPYQYSWTVPAQGAMTYSFTATAYDNAGNSAVSTVQVGPQNIAATNILQTTNESSPSDWNSAIWGTPAAIPVSTNNYETPSGFTVRTSNINTGASPQSFSGNSLQIDAGGILYLKHNNIVETVNLVLNGGEIDYHGAPGGTNSPLAGTLQVLANSTVTSDQNGVSVANVDIWLQSSLSGSGNLTVAQDTVTNGVVLFGNNAAYSGNWTNTGGFIEVGGGTINPLGSGSVTLVNTANYLEFNSTNNLVVNNLIAGAGSVLMQNTGSVTLTANNTFTGNLTISAGTLALTGSIGGTPLIRLSSGAVLNVAAVPGGFAVGSLQTLAGSGSVSGNVTVNGMISPRPLGTLNFANNLALSGTAVLELNRSNAQNADLIAASTLGFGGILTVTNIGGALQAGDSFQLFSGAISGVFTVTNLPALSSTNLDWDMSELNSEGIIMVVINPALAPTITQTAMSGTNLTLQVNSQSGFNYVLEATPQLALANWTPIQTNAGGGVQTFTIPISAGAQQFFRICVQQ
jgi:autotransporter-associated beta strand protein